MKASLALFTAFVLVMGCGGGGEVAEGESPSVEGAAPEAPASTAPAAAGSWSSAEAALDRQAELWNDLADVLAGVHSAAEAQSAAPRIDPIADEIEATNRYLEEHPLAVGPTMERSQRLLDAQQRYAGEMARISREDIQAVPILADRAPGN